MLLIMQKKWFKLTHLSILYSSYVLGGGAQDSSLLTLPSAKLGARFSALPSPSLWFDMEGGSGSHTIDPGYLEFFIPERKKQQLPVDSVESFSLDEERLSARGGIDNRLDTLERAKRLGDDDLEADHDSIMEPLGVNNAYKDTGLLEMEWAALFLEWSLAPPVRKSGGGVDGDSTDKDEKKSGGDESNKNEPAESTEDKAGDERVNASQEESSHYANSSVREPIIQHNRYYGRLNIQAGLDFITDEDSDDNCKIFFCEHDGSAYSEGSIDYIVMNKKEAFFLFDNLNQEFNEGDFKVYPPLEGISGEDFLLVFEVLLACKYFSGKEVSDSLFSLFNGDFDRSIDILFSLITGFEYLTRKNSDKLRATCLLFLSRVLEGRVLPLSYLENISAICLNYAPGLLSGGKNEIVDIIATAISLDHEDFSDLGERSIEDVYPNLTDTISGMLNAKVLIIVPWSRTQEKQINKEYLDELSLVILMIKYFGFPIPLFYYWDDRLSEEVVDKVKTIVVAEKSRPINGSSTVISMLREIRRLGFCFDSSKYLSIRIGAYNNISGCSPSNSYSCGEEVYSYDLFYFHFPLNLESPGQVACSYQGTRNTIERLYDNLPRGLPWCINEMLEKLNKVWSDQQESP